MKAVFKMETQLLVNAATLNVQLFFTTQSFGTVKLLLILAYQSA